jgi:hypothetical protein
MRGVNAAAQWRFGGTAALSYRRMLLLLPIASLTSMIQSSLLSFIIVFPATICSFFRAFPARFSLARLGGKYFTGGCLAFLHEKSDRDNPMDRFDQ